MTDQEALALYHTADNALSSYTCSAREYQIAFTRKLLELAAAPAQAEPAGWRAFLETLTHTAGGMVSGNQLSRTAKELLDAAPAQAEPSDDAKDAARYRYLRAGDPNTPRDIDVVDEGMTVIVGDDLDRWCDEGIRFKS